MKWTNNIAGHNGSIDGQGTWWWEQHRKKSMLYTRGRLVELMWSSNVEIKDVTLKNSPFWHLHPYDCTNVTIQRVTILAPLDAPNTDGIDPGEKIHHSISFFFYHCKPSRSYSHMILDGV
jgi:polygalacturonase